MTDMNKQPEALREAQQPAPATELREQEPPTVAELVCVCGAEWEWRNRDWELVTTPPAQPQHEPVSDRENAIIRFALHQFMSNAYSNMNAAAQDKDSRYYTAGAVEKFAKDAKDAEALLSRLQFKAPKPAQQEPVAVPTTSYEHRKFVLVGREWYERFAAFHDDCQIGEQLTWQEKTIRQQGYENGWNDAQRYLKEPQATSPTPAQRTWVNATTWRGLTVDEILYCVELENPKAIVEEVEAKLREKNGITRSKHDQ